MIGNLIDTGACNVLLSEENESPIYVPIEKRGVYLVAFDPLDGSSNIECNAPIGTIFSICENKEEHVLINGNMIEIAGYILYGPSTELVISVDCKVDRFVLSPRGEYIHVGSVSLEGKTKKIYSVNEANSMTWENDVKSYIDQYKTGCSGYSARYIGSMVGDVHRTLLYGGIFSYPADKKNKDGKLRLLYECYPIAKLFEDAGGKALVGNMSDQRILDAEPKAIHQRSPVLFGTLQEVEKYEIILRNIVSKL
jgi:fructose-1,6-bisphosphatase I